MTDLAELERRITDALARVDAGLDRLKTAQVAAETTAEASEGEAAVAAAPDGAEPETGGAEPETGGAEAAEGQAPTPEESAAAPDNPADHQAELAELRAALAAERASNGALMDRIRTLKTREQRQEAALQARIEKLTKQLDVQGLELNRLRKNMIQLREAMRVLREGAEGQTVDAAMINKALLAELEGLRAARSSETIELEEIIAELAALIGEESADA